MNTNHRLFKIVSIIVLLSLALGVVVGIPARAMQINSESAPPAGLSTEDWAQIQGLLGSTLPAQQTYLKASNTGLADFFGYGVAISGDTVVVGAHYEDSSATGVNGDQSDNSSADSGAVYVFIRSGMSWTQQAYLKASNTDAGDAFGITVAISGDTLVVGAYYEDGAATGVNGNQADNTAADSGAVYVFTRSGTTWSQQAYLKASNTGANDLFGATLSIDGDTVVVGAQGEDSNATGVNGNQSDNSAVNSGAAYVFTRSGTTWNQQAYLKASNTEAYDNFGFSVAISGETVAVGARYEDSNATGVNGNQADNLVTDSGATYVFTRSGTTWSQQAYLKASNTGWGDDFGFSLSIFEDTLVVGADMEDSNATGVNGDQSNNAAADSGAAYVFTRSGTTWSQQAYLKASNTGPYDAFGFSIALQGELVVIGAYMEDSNATGVNGNQADNSAAESGAAYVFARSGTSWSQQGYLKASNTGSNDAFGRRVGISGDKVVVGAWGEDSSATGVNGNQNDNSVANSGAVYAYLQKYTTNFFSIGTYDGWILESGENTNLGGTLDSTSTTFRLGDEVGDKQYRSLLSFNTASLPDTAVITKVTLKIKKQEQVGWNPFTILGGLRVDIRKPFFGTTLGLVVNDFQSFPGKSAVATFGVTPVSNWYSAVIGNSGYPYINKTGTTQFRLRFFTDDNDDGAADYMKFFSGNYTYAVSRPTLVIEYFVP